MRHSHTKSFIPNDLKLLHGLEEEDVNSSQIYHPFLKVTSDVMYTFWRLNRAGLEPRNRLLRPSFLFSCFLFVAYDKMPSSPLGFDNNCSLMMNARWRLGKSSMVYNILGFCVCIYTYIITCLQGWGTGSLAFIMNSQRGNPPVRAIPLLFYILIFIGMSYAHIAIIYWLYIMCLNFLVHIDSHDSVRALTDSINYIH